MNSLEFGVVVKCALIRYLTSISVYTSKTDVYTEMLTGMSRCCVLEENVCKIWNGEQEKCDALKYNSEMFEEHLHKYYGLCAKCK